MADKNTKGPGETRRGKTDTDKKRNLDKNAPKGGETPRTGPGEAPRTGPGEAPRPAGSGTDGGAKTGG